MAAPASGSPANPRVGAAILDEGKKLTGVGVHGEGGAEAGNPPSGLGGAGRSEALSAILDEGGKALKRCFGDPAAIWPAPWAKRDSLPWGQATASEGPGGSGVAGPARAEVLCEELWRPLRHGPKMAPSATEAGAEESDRPTDPTSV